MILCLPLIKGSFMTVISAYAPTLVSDETTKDSFYSCLHATLQAVPRNDRLVILGDFNAWVGTNHNVWSGVIRKHGLGNANSNGLLLNLCSGPDLICLQILLLPYLPASLYPSIPRYQNNFHYCHFYCSLQA